MPRHRVRSAPVIRIDHHEVGVLGAECPWALFGRQFYVSEVPREVSVGASRPFYEYQGEYQDPEYQDHEYSTGFDSAPMLAG